MDIQHSSSDDAEIILTTDVPLEPPAVDNPDENQA